MLDCSRFYIDGQWIKPATGSFMDLINPATAEKFGRVVLGRQQDVDAAVAAAKRALATYETSSRELRLTYFDQIISAYEARKKDLAEAITLEIGSPISFSTNVQVEMALNHFLATREVLKSYPFEFKIANDVVRREPFGVVGLITAWNWPVALIASKVCGALAAGCTIVLKPSEYSPVAARIFAEIIDAAGLPPGVFNMIYGDGPTVGRSIATHPDIALVSFTGSVQTGIAIARDAAETVKAVHQELGGKSANIILPDADLKTAIPDAVRRAFINCGQSCIAPTRLLIHADQVERAAEIAKRTAEAFKIGDPFDPTTTLGPLANRAQFLKVNSMIGAGLAEGARLVCGGPGFSSGIDRGYFVQPTIFKNVTPKMKIAAEEIFGPVLSILSYHDEEDAIQIANNTSFGLAGYVFSSSVENAKRVGEKLKAGRIFVNGAPSNATAPFGGYKQSGNGREAGVFGLEAFLEVKAIIG
jgi:aldehyde dehydrogenase (NAD+)